MDECLSVEVPVNVKLEKLRGQQQAREEKPTAKVTAGLEEARSVRQAKRRVESALKLLEKTPEDLGTLSSEDSMISSHNCGQLAELHEAAMRAVEAASAEEIPVALITGYESDISGYRHVLTTSAVEDPKFLSVCDSVASKFSQLRGAAEQKRKRKRTIRIAIVGVAVVLLLPLLLPLISAVLELRSSRTRIVEQQNAMSNPYVPPETDPGPKVLEEKKRIEKEMEMHLLLQMQKQKEMQKEQVPKKNIAALIPNSIGDAVCVMSIRYV